MDYSERDTLFLRQRVEKLENQNRRVWRFCFLQILVLVLLIIACAPRPVSVVEAQKFILRDSSGKVRVEITMDHDNPAINLFGENGKARTLVGAGFLTIHGGEGAQVTLLDQILQFESSNGLVAARLDSSSGSGNLRLFSYEPPQIVQSIVLDSSAPAVDLVDHKGFEANLGSNHLVTPSTGEAVTTSAATLVLSTEDGKIIWRSPR